MQCLSHRFAWQKQRPFPPVRFCCPRHRRYYDLLRLLCPAFLRISANNLIPSITRQVKPRQAEVSTVPLSSFHTSHPLYPESHPRLQVVSSSTKDHWPSSPF